MKKLSFLFLISILSCITVLAQPWVNTQSPMPVNIYGVMNEYKLHKKSYILHDDKKEISSSASNELVEKETGDYLFERWAWYWKQHTDINGNLISPVKNWEEWEKYKKISHLKNARITGSDPSDWRFVGPDKYPASFPSGGVGRIATIEFHPTDANTYWIGSDGGGAWKTTNNGGSWVCMTDNLPNVSSVCDIDINPLNPNTIYLCTGDRDGHSYYGIGVLKSYNGGATWDITGLKYNTSQLLIANCLVINPIDTNCIIVGASDGIYKSTNGGTTWTKKCTGNFKQILYHPGDTTILYSALYYDRFAGTSAQIYRSVDGGNTWTQITSFSKVCRVALAVSASQPYMLKALTASSDSSNNLFGLEGVYNSTDEGRTFSKLVSGGCSNNLLDWNILGLKCGGQGWYDLVFTMNQVNYNEVYLGGINAWRSTDGGSNWAPLSQWDNILGGLPVTHGDKHFAVYHPLIPGRLFECNDGGICYTDMPSSSSVWKNVTNGLGITEFYSNAVSNIASFELGGAQDNGTMWLRNDGVFTILGGDGMQCQLDYVDSDTYYMSYVFGAIYRVSNISPFATISNNIPGAPKGAWLTPYVLEPSCHNCLIAGYKQVYQSADYGDSWRSISPVFDTGRYISCIGVTAADANTVYAVPADTNIIYATFDMGGTWSTIVADSGRISAIEVDPEDKTHIWVTFSGYGRNKVAEYRPSSGWINLRGYLPDVPVNCIRIDTSTRVLYIGTDVGVFYKTSSGPWWATYNNGMPVVRISQLNINYATGKIWAATYGRGMWVSSKAMSAPNPDNIQIENTTDEIVISPNPNNGNFIFSTSNRFANKRVYIWLTDNTGKIVWSSVGQFDGTGKIQINAPGLAKGIYYFQSAVDNTVVTKRKIVVD